MTDEIKFAYLRDPVNSNRVVTLAWTQKPDGDKLDVQYAFAVNRVASPHNHPERIKSGVQKHHDRHCKKIGRAVAKGRYQQDSAETCGHNLLTLNKSVVEAIIDDYLSIYEDLNKKISCEIRREEIDNGPIEYAVEYESHIRWRLRRVLQLKKLLSLRKTVKEVFERIKKWHDRQVR